MISYGKNKLGRGLYKDKTWSPNGIMQAHCIHTGKQADKQNKKTENNNVTQDKVIT